MTKRIRIFAGPNGSGKSALKELIASQFNIGVYVNADEMKVAMQSSSRLEFSDYQLSIAADSFEKAYSGWPIPTTRDWWKFEANGITVLDKGKMEDYFVSFLADFIRNSLLRVVDHFSFETVMSHPSKLDFINNARLAGYKVYLYYVSLPDPNLNILRVKTRVNSGGHDVDSEKVTRRYYRSLDLLFDAIRLADSAFLFDNLYKEPALFARKEKGELRTEGKYIPQWYKQYVLDKIGRKSDSQ